MAYASRQTHPYIGQTIAVAASITSAQPIPLDSRRFMLSVLNIHDREALTVSTALRRATAARHHRIEAVLQLEGEIDPQRYGRIVQGFERFLGGWEPRIASALPVSLQAWFSGRSRRAMAQRDMRALALESPLLPDFSPAIGLGSLAAAFGSMYVMEGSALGGRVIARELAKRHHIGPCNGGAYFNGWGADTGSMWRDFGGLLSLHADGDERMRSEACTAAVQTFDALIAMFEKQLDGLTAI